MKVKKLLTVVENFIHEFFFSCTDDYIEDAVIFTALNPAKYFCNTKVGGPSEILLPWNTYFCYYVYGTYYMVRNCISVSTYNYFIFS